MKVITEPKDSIVKLWGHPKGTAGTTYRLMNYTLQNECDDGTLLYSIVTSEMVLISDDDFDIRTLPAMYSPAMDELISKHFLVPEDFDEKKSVDQLRVIMRKLNKPKRISGYTIYPTTCCNARCFYCFENNFVKETMTEETAEAVVKYIADHCGGQSISITWFGGEPLVGRHIIDYICKRLNELKIPFASNMVSNAYLFDAEVAKTAVDLWKLKNVQITLDGTEEIYNATKAYQGVTGSPYQRVLDNIGLVLKAGIGVAVRLNVTQENIDNLFTLVDDLSIRFAGKKGFQAYSHVVYDDVGYAPVNHTEEAKEPLWEQTLLLEDKLVNNHLSPGIQKLPCFKEIRCMADNDVCVTVFPNGKLGKCENRPQDEAVADIWGNEYPENFGLCKEYCSYEMCNNCSLYPECLHLAVCPEHGNCSQRKAANRIESGGKLIRHKYDRYKAKQEESTVENQIFGDCV